MSLSSATLSSIQIAGAAVFTADAELKNAVREYADRVHSAIASNPYHLGNDTLFENWKVVARLSQTLAGIEEELKKVYHIASELISDDQPVVVEVAALAAPAPDAAKSTSNPMDITPSDAVVKAKKQPKKAVSTPISGQPPSNADKLRAYFDRNLNSKKFTAINQTVASQETGIPLGSMTAAIKRLTAKGQLIAGPSNSFKLVKSKH